MLSQVPQKGDWLFITRKGLALLDQSDPGAYVKAEARLEVDLHPSIAQRVRNRFVLGECELVALAAMRQVEIRVRAL